MSFVRYSRLLTVALVCLAIASSASYLAWPLSADAGVHITGIHQSLMAGREFLQAWTFRGFTYNAYLLGLYRFATTFVDFFDRASFDPLIKTAHLVVIVGGIAVWSGGLARRYALGAELRLRAAAVALFAMTSNSATLTLHAEDVGLVVTLYGWGAALRRGLAWQAAAGLAVGILPLLKGVTALYAVPVLATSLLVCGFRSRDFLVACAGAALTFGALSGFLWLFAPVQLSDLVDAATFQGSMNASAEQRWERFSERWGRYLLFNPVFLPGALAALGHLGGAVQKRDWQGFAFVLGLWLIGPICLVVQHHYFTYHFAPVVLASAYSLAACFTWLTEEEDRPTKKLSTLVPTLGFAVLALTVLVDPRPDPKSPPLQTPLLLVATLAALALVLLLRAIPRTPTHFIPSSLVPALLVPLALVLWVGSPRAAATPTRLDVAWSRVLAQEKKFKALEEHFDLRGKTVLLAGYGSSARHLDVVSACRHFFPIPLQRWKQRSAKSFKERPGYREARECFRRYRGDFVLVQENWFPSKKVLARLGVPKQYRPIERLGSKDNGYVLLKRKRPNSQ